MPPDGRYLHESGDFDDGLDPVTLLEQNEERLGQLEQRDRSYRPDFCGGCGEDYGRFRLNGRCLRCKRLGIR